MKKILSEIDTKLLSERLTSAVKRIMSKSEFNKKVEIKLDGSVLSHLDEILQNEIQVVLKEHWPEYGFLAEEMSVFDRGKVLAKSDQAFWCLDPLDGTSNFTAGNPFWCVSLGLIDKDQIYAGIVYDFERDECFTALKGQGAFLNGKKIVKKDSVQELEHCIANIDFKRLDKKLAHYLIDTQKFRSQRNFGSCALEWCWLAVDRIQVYLHGGMKLWDYAAGQLILEEAMGASSNLLLEPVFNPKQENQSVIAASNKKLFSLWSNYLEKCKDS